ncbi:MAG: ABC transporter substrate-binding protein, partial [Desulfobacterales bacterium]|nr:ABC transporter substrate-binding protein [Desulfobacterales bacterium]
QEKVIKIGVIYPYSGALAATGEILRSAVDLAVDYINNYHPEFAQEGIYFPIAEWEGISTLGGAKIEVIHKDHRAEPDRGADLAKSLILDEQVDGLMGCYNSSVTKTASTVAERYGVPFINAASTSPTLTERGYEWFFRTTPHDRYFTKDLFELLEGLTEGAVKGVEAVPKEELDDLASASENTEWGAGVDKLIKEFAEEYDYNVVESLLYPHESPDLTSEVGKLLAAEPDALLFASYVSDAILFIKTLKEHKAAPNLLWGMDAGFVIPDFIETIGPDTEGILSRTLFSAKLTAVKPLTKLVNDEFKSRTGEDLTGVSGRAFTGMQAWAYVLAKAGSTDPEAIREVANKIIIPGDELIMPWRGINYEDTETETNQNTWAKGLIIQYQDQEPEIIYPFDLATADMVYPFPGWAD